MLIVTNESNSTNFKTRYLIREIRSVSEHSCFSQKAGKMEILCVDELLIDLHLVY